MTQVTNLGFLRTRLDERFAQLQADYRAIYGEDIQVDADDIDGEFLGLLGQAINDVDSLAEVVYNNLNPQSATGLGQSRLVQLNGIKRLAGSFSTGDIEVGGSQNTLIPAGSMVKDAVTGVRWITQSDVTIGVSGLAIVSTKAETMGAIAASAGNLTKIDTPIFGWQTVTNPDSAVIGRDEETDEELRARRTQSTNTPAQCILDAVYGSIINLTGVRVARVYENFSDAVDGNGQAPHSIYSVVEGGVIADIADIIWLKKTAGTTMVGAITTPVLDSQGLVHNVKFSRPAYSDVYIVVNVTRQPGYPSDGAARIKAALVAYGLTLAIGDDVQQPRLYTPVNVVPFHKITALTLGLAPAPGGTADIVVPFDGLARIDTTRIVVNET